MINKASIISIEKYFEMNIKDKITRTTNLFGRVIFKINEKEVTELQIFTRFNSQKFNIYKTNEGYLVKYKPCIRIWICGDNIENICGSSIQFYFKSLEEMVYVYNELMKLINDKKSSMFIDLNHIIDLLVLKYNEVV